MKRKSYEIPNRGEDDELKWGKRYKKLMYKMCFMFNYITFSYRKFNLLMIVVKMANTP